MNDRTEDTTEDTTAQPVRILFVCLGNICRSPMAEGVFRAVAAARGFEDDVVTDSAGTGSWHAGAPPDPRGQEAAGRRGIDISDLRARQVVAEDFDIFDLILAMDENNLAALKGAAAPARVDRVRLFLDFAPDAGRADIPDPYYGGDDGFDHVLDLIEMAGNGLADHVAGLVQERRQGRRG